MNFDIESHQLYLDNHLLVLNKPAGLLIQGDQTGDPSLLNLAKVYLKQKFNKPGNVFLGLVHRLDRPASGVVVFARTSKAARRLAEQFRSREVTKIYWILAEGDVPSDGVWQDYLARDGVTSRVVDAKSGRLARLRFRRLDYRNGISRVEVILETGRHHQIRVQFAHRGYPILGDFRYGSKRHFGDRALALHAYSLTIRHPTRKEKMTFTDPPDQNW